MNRNKIEGEKGVCMLDEPKVASTTLHPAPPQSYTVFMAGCNFICLNCQNWNIAHYPIQKTGIRGSVDPRELAKEAVEKIRSTRGKMIGADRIFFSGGSPTPSLPFIEEVVKEAEQVDPEIKVNYDTNGFMTKSTLNRVTKIAESITFDFKAYNDDVHRALTGAPVEPVLRNARILVEKTPEKLWEFRYLLIPGINEGNVEDLSEFLAGIDEDIPLNFLAFRPNFVLEDHPGATKEEMRKAVKTAKEAGLENVSWSGRTGLPGTIPNDSGASLANKIARKKGCVSEKRDCSSCEKNKDCNLKSYNPGSERLI